MPQSICLSRLRLHGFLHLYATRRISWCTAPDTADRRGVTHAACWHQKAICTPLDDTGIQGESPYLPLCSINWVTGTFMATVQLAVPSWRRLPDPQASALCYSVTLGR